MTEQFSLPGFPAQSLPPDKLFVGVFPDSPAANRATGIRENTRSAHRLTGTPVAPDRLHVTLVHLGDYFGRPEAIVRMAREAAATVVVPPFDVVLDRAGGFSHPSGGLLVLRGDQGVKQLKAFQQTLIAALLRAGLGNRVNPTSTLHMTLLYKVPVIPEEPVDPVAWTVHEFVLVHSLVGQSRHLALGRWPLRG